jgi:hypothetical protein
MNPPTPPVTPVEVSTPERPSAAAVEVGRYVALPSWDPSVLLQRQGEAYPWTPLRPEGKVATACTLVSLPGYRSLVALDGGVHLTLWGNVPEFSTFPPVLESAVMLNVPAPGVDLDFTLDRGRVLLANHKPGGSALIRLRFLHETWDLTLPAPGSEAAVELWSRPPEAPAAGGKRQPPVLCLGLFTKGDVVVERSGRKLPVADRSRLSWTSAGSTLFPAAPMSQLPDWWTKPPDRKQEEVQDVLLTLKDWSGRLAATAEVVDGILTWVRDRKRDRTDRMVGLLFLAALDEVAHLAEFLEDDTHAAVRGTAAHALRSWVARADHHAAEMHQILRERRGYARDKADLIVELLQPLSEAERRRPDTYQRLVGHLRHENLAVRDLAHWHLMLLVPQGRNIPYDPAGEAGERARAVAKWEDLLPGLGVKRAGS